MPPPDTAPQREVPPWASGTEGRHDEIYPRLGAAELATVRSYGEEQEIGDGARLWEIGQPNVSLYVVLEGALEITRRDELGEHVVVVHGPGNFSGDIGAMIAEHLGDVLVVGEPENGACARAVEFLLRNGVPFDVLRPGSDSGASRMRALGIGHERLPVVVCGERRLVQPSNRELAACLGMLADLPSGATYDMVVIGAGPAGLAAAVYGASEGLRVLAIERNAVGGQAGSSSRIENYLGFPTGISGQALTARGFLQAHKFGAEVAIAREVLSLQCGSPFHTVHLDGGDFVYARAVVLATGATYRQPQIQGLSDLEGSCVHYGASHIQGMLCRDKNVAVIGGGNSAGRAAMFLAQRAKKVSLIVRGTGLGATPATQFVDRKVLLDTHGFVRTGDSLDRAELAACGWPLARLPLPYETSCPRIFVAGDVRSGSSKRVASAVGEGSVCVQLIHRALELDATAGEPGRGASNTPAGMNQEGAP